MHLNMTTTNTTIRNCGAAALLPTLGGQTGLNTSLALDDMGVLAAVMVIAALAARSIRRRPG